MKKEEENIAYPPMPVFLVLEVVKAHEGGCYIV